MLEKYFCKLFCSLLLFSKAPMVQSTLYTDFYFFLFKWAIVG